MIEVSPSYLLQKHINEKSERLASYRQRPTATEAGVRMMTEDIKDLMRVLEMIKSIEPVGLMTHIADTIKRNALLGVDITCVLIPNRENIPEYKFANAVIADLTDSKIGDMKALYDMHSTGEACVEVDDFTGNGIDNILKAYANRGELYDRIEAWNKKDI